MARTRIIKPGFFENEDLAECSAHARLLYIGLWCHADRRGILEDRPKWLKFNILPMDDVSPTALLNELESHGFIERYERDGKKCIIIPKFQNHQYPHQNEKANDLPLPESTVHVPDHSTSSTRALGPVNMFTVNGVKKKEPSVPKKKPELVDRASRIKPDWQPDERLIQYARDQGIVNVPAEVVEFVDYYIVNNKVMLDWPRVWMRWCRNDYRSKNRKRNHHPAEYVNSQAI